MRITPVNNISFKKHILELQEQAEIEREYEHYKVDKVFDERQYLLTKETRI